MDITRTFIRMHGNTKVFKYRNGIKKCTQEEMTRIKKLCIPPNWDNVKIANSPISYLQATGNDSKKVQYIYHPMWIFLTKSEKYRRMGLFSKKINAFCKKIKGSVEPINIMFMILQKTHIRVGNDCYAKDNGTYGLASLEKRHIKINKNNINLSFIGKKGVSQSITFKDNTCLTFLKNKLKTITSKDRVFNISPSVLNKYLQDNIGDIFTCKDFRTYASNMLFLKLLCKLELPNTQKEIKNNLKTTYDSVAKQLGHTKEISKKSYVMPIFSDQYMANPEQFANKNPKVIFNTLVR